MIAQRWDRPHQYNLPFQWWVKETVYRIPTTDWLDHSLSLDHMRAGVAMTIDYYAYHDKYLFTVVR